jgi:preprotein translocase subunit SecF
MELVKQTHIDFLGKGKIFVPLSLVLCLASLALVAAGRIRYGVEFSGGTQLILRFQSTPQIDRIRDVVGKMSAGAVIQTYGEPATNQVLVRLAGAGSEGSDLTSLASSVLSGLAKDYPENPVKDSSTEIVGPIVGAELRQKAIQLTLFGLVFQLIYIAFRFGGIVWGAGATVAVFHDVIITLGLLILFKYEITLNVIAALLTLVGYSVNDTIVIFDRVRENLKHRRKDPLPVIINDSVNQTLSRTLISNGTTFLTVLGLYLFGGEVLSGFAFTMVVGIIVGSYSTIYIASPVVVWGSRFARKGQPPRARAAL